MDRYRWGETTYANVVQLHDDDGSVGVVWIRVVRWDGYRNREGGCDGLDRFVEGVRRSSGCQDVRSVRDK